MADGRIRRSAVSALIARGSVAGAKVWSSASAAIRIVANAVHKV